VRAELDLRQGAVNPQNAARSQNTVIATSHTRQSRSSRTRRGSLLGAKSLLVPPSARIKHKGCSTRLTCPFLQVVTLRSIFDQSHKKLLCFQFLYTSY
jgi:hypothetical protein